MTAALDIRLLHTADEMSQVEALEQAVWPGADTEIVPGHLLLTAGHNGGLVAGAWAGERLAGFVFGFLGFQEAGTARRLKHCSHMLGVHPDFRGAGLGYALKVYQREYVLRQGIELITWTYDPLLARNAQLNIAKLGAVCTTYLPNLYGSMHDGLNAGLPSDRFQVDWWIATQWVVDHLSRTPRHDDSKAELPAADAAWLNPARSDGEPLPPDPHVIASVPAATILVEIPADFLTLKAADPALALRWRMGTRAAFQALFRQGYAVTDFVRQPGSRPRAAYVLTRTSSLKERIP